MAPVREQRVIDPETQAAAPENPTDTDARAEADRPSGTQRRRAPGPTPKEQALRAAVRAGLGTLPEEMEW